MKYLISIKQSFAFFLLLVSNCYSQNYRNIDAYISDFAKNEVYINSAIIEYNKSIINSEFISRKEDTSAELIEKLEKINTILINNDIGFKGDTTLRDALMKLNATIISYFKNDLVSLSDYKKQSLLSIYEIEENLNFKENEIVKLYSEFNSYENAKDSFGKKNKIAIKTNKNVNIFEYNAYQNFIFYKINVLDEKFLSIIDKQNLEELKECNYMILKSFEESSQKTADLGNYAKDSSLNTENISLIKYFSEKNKILYPLAHNFLTFNKNFQDLKKNYNESDSNYSIEEYNKNVRYYNSLKNELYNNLYSINLEKNKMINQWCHTNKTFLKNNLNLDISTYEFVENND